MSTHQEERGTQVSWTRTKLLSSLASSTPRLSASTVTTTIVCVDGLPCGAGGESNLFGTFAGALCGSSPAQVLRSYWLRPLLADHGLHDELSAHNCRELLLAHCNEMVWSMAATHRAPKKIVQLLVAMKRARRRGRILEHRLRQRAPPYRTNFYACLLVVSWASSIVPVCAVYIATPRWLHVACCLKGPAVRCRSAIPRGGRWPALAKGIGRH